MFVRIRQVTHNHRYEMSRCKLIRGRNLHLRGSFHGPRETLALLSMSLHVNKHALASRLVETNCTGQCRSLQRAGQISTHGLDAKCKPLNSVTYLSVLQALMSHMIGTADLPGVRYRILPIENFNNIRKASSL